MEDSGILYVVATPIGNLDDITPRAKQVLSQVALIAAEDKRHSAKLCQAYDIKTNMIALHDHNEQEALLPLIEKLQSGLDIALISDAGTPLISDPGYHLVAAVRAAGIRVCPLPGACAAITALSAAGLPSNHFYFEGFLPSKSQGRALRLSELATMQCTLIFYEAPHRIGDCVAAMALAFGKQRQVVLARELTKMFETIHSGTFGEMIDWLAADPNQSKGEFVILVAHDKAASLAHNEQLARKAYELLQAELPKKQAIKLAASIADYSKNALYSWVHGQDED